MLSTIELLDLAKEVQGDVSDYRISKMLGLNPSHVSGYRSGRSLPSNAVAIELARLCNLDPATVMVWVNIERAGTETDRMAWEILLSRLAPQKRPKLAA